jgi:hypothetical protein
MYRQRSLVILVTICALLWIAAISVGIAEIKLGDEARGLGVVEDLLRAISATVTITLGLAYRAGRLTRSRFEHGYLAAQCDSRPARVTSIASHQFGEKIPEQDRYGSNKLG